MGRSRAHGPGGGVVDTGDPSAAQRNCNTRATSSTGSCRRGRKWNQSYGGTDANDRDSYGRGGSEKFHFFPINGMKTGFSFEKFSHFKTETNRSGAVKAANIPILAIL